MPDESETFEEKSVFEWSSAGKQFDILKTIVAFANCDGGEIFISKCIGDEGKLDSARLDDFCSKYVQPPVRGISSSKDQGGGWTIRVSKSPFAPHVVSEGGNYLKTNQANGKTIQRPAFYPGQVYVRHSSKSEPATADDFQRMIREGVSSWLSSLGTAVANVGLSEGAHDQGVPMRLVEGGPALSITLEESHPYSASDIGRAFGKKGSWIGKLVNAEGMRHDIRYSKKLTMYSDPVWVFSDAAKDRIGEILKAEPDYNPYSRKKAG